MHGRKPFSLEIFFVFIRTCLLDWLVVFWETGSVEIPLDYEKLSRLISDGR